LILAAIGGVTYLQTQTQLQDTTEQRLETAAVSQSTNLGAWITNLKRDAELVSESDAVAGGDRTRIDQYLNESVRGGTLDPSVMAVHYLDTSTPVIRASSNQQFVGVNPRTQGVPWAQNDLDLNGADPFVSDAFPGPRVDEPVVAVVAPVDAVDDRAIVLMVNVGNRTGRLSQHDQGTFTRVVNANGTIVISQRRGEILKQNTPGTDGVTAGAVERGLDDGTGYAQRDENGTTAVMGYAAVDGVDWVVTVRTSKTQAFALQRFVSRNLMALLVVAVLGLLGVGLLVGRPTARALDDLSTTATAIAAGNVEREVPRSTRSDELGDVQRAFRETRDYVRTVTDQVEALAAQEFDDDAFETDVPGPLGTAIEDTRQELRTSIENIETARDDAETARQNAEAIADRLNDQAEQFRDVMDEIADGDLTRRLDADVDDAAMTDIAESTNRMLDELETTVARVRNFADDVDESVTLVDSSAEEIESTSQQIASTSQQIADGAARQDEHLDEAVGEVGDLSATVEEIAASSNEVAQQATAAADLGQEGCQQAKAAATDISAIADQVETVTDEVRQLDEEMERIGDIVVLIDDIAEQTNLLALNANIEAARADGGQNADGFAVVADEVKTLAEETSERTDEISDIIRGVQDSTSELAEEMQDARERMVDGAASVTETKDIFEDVVDRVEEATDGIHAIDEATDEQARATEELVTMVDDVSQISSETADGTGDLAAAAEEQTAAISSVTDSIDDLADRAERLSSLTGEFEVRAEMEADPD
jgi:methyl-accepting chemotaxis protein